VARRAFAGALASNEYTKTLVSRKNLPFIHFGPREVTAGTDMAEALHQRVYFLGAPRLRRILLQPFPKSRIQGFVPGASYSTGLLD
jgi:hypothetical protein